MKNSIPIALKKRNFQKMLFHGAMQKTADSRTVKRFLYFFL
jgi:hypothetical protein